MPLPSKWWRWFYSRESKAWDRRAREPAVAAIVDERVALLERELALEGPVVDVGCGPGTYARRVPRYTVGVDLAPGMLARAAEHGGIGLVQADLAQGLPFRDSAFAGGLGVVVLQHVSDVPSALGEIRRVVARKGPILLTVPAKERPPRQRMGLYWSLRPVIARMSGAVHFLTVERFRELLVGFDVAELYTERGTHVALVRNTKPL